MMSLMIPLANNSSPHLLKPHLYPAGMLSLPYRAQMAYHQAELTLQGG